MKLQLNEGELSAYINEAIQQELNENYRVNFEKLGEPELQVIKNHKAARRRLERGAYNRMSLISTGKLRKVLNDMGYSDDQIRAGLSNGAIEVGNGVDNSFRPYQNIYRQNRKDARLRSRMNMPVAGNGQDGQGEQENQTGAWDGSFPWDGYPIRWTPVQRRTPTTTQNQQTQTQPAQEEQPQRREQMPALERPALQMPALVDAPKQELRGVERPQARFPQNAISSMARIAGESPANLSQQEKNAALRQTRDNAIHTINGDGYGADRATRRADKKDVRDAYRTIRRGNQNQNI